jgi:hypothetical protein
MTSTRTAFVRRSSFAVVTVVALATGLPAGLWGQTPTDNKPRGVSPGSVNAAERLAGSCPTFSWSSVDDARGYELVLYQMTERGTLESVLETTIEGDAHTWTPSLAHCPASGSQYAWAVRALSDEGTGGWSEPMLFSTAWEPTEDEVRQALLVLQRYLRARNTDTAVDVAGATPTLPQLAGAALSAPTVGATPTPRTVTPPASFSLSIDGDFDLGGAVFKEGGTPFIHNDGGDDYFNTAVGLTALTNSTPGSPEVKSGARNSAFGNRALRFNTSGYQNTASGYKALYANETGERNTATGSRALSSNTEGDDNTAIGRRALNMNTSGSRNTATGVKALHSNIDGYKNTATGFSALSSNTAGYQNTASGAFAMFNTTGDNNTATGNGAMFSNDTGSYNTAFGAQAGSAWTTGDDNIALGRGSSGVAAETGTIRIGGGGFQTRTFIEGIFGVSPSGAFQSVVIDSSGQLGTGVSDSGSLTFSSGSTCDVQTLTVTGAASGKTVLLGPPSSFGADLVATAWVSAADTVSVRVCAIGGGTLGTAADGTYNAAVL